MQPAARITSEVGIPDKLSIEQGNEIERFWPVPFKPLPCLLYTLVREPQRSRAEAWQVHKSA
jgi:hypothetical protein